VLGEIVSPVAVEFAVTQLPSAAMGGDQHRRLVQTLRPVEIAEQLDAVMLGKKYVRFDRDFVLFSHLLTPDPPAAPQRLSQDRSLSGRGCRRENGASRTSPNSAAIRLNSRKNSAVRAKNSSVRQRSGISPKPK